MYLTPHFYGKPIRWGKCGQLLEISLRKSAKAYRSFEEVLQVVHPHLANTNDSQIALKKGVTVILDDATHYTEIETSNCRFPGS